MRILRSLGLAALLAGALAFVPAAAHAQIAVGIGIGPVVDYPAPVYVAGPPACEWGYYSYYPYACAPYGYYGPDWFYDGLFIGAGPWFNGWYGPWGWGFNNIGYWGWRGRYGYGGYGFRNGAYRGIYGGSAYRGGAYGRAGFGAYNRGGAYRGTSAYRGNSGGSRSFSAGRSSGGARSFGGGGGGFHGGGGGGGHGR